MCGDILKDTVKRKLAWVKSGINRQLMISYGAAGHFFEIKGP
jgi:hypothetical protein